MIHNNIPRTTVTGDLFGGEIAIDQKIDAQSRHIIDSLGQKIDTHMSQTAFNHMTLLTKIGNMEKKVENLSSCVDWLLQPVDGIRVMNMCNYLAIDQSKKGQPFLESYCCDGNFLAPGHHYGIDTCSLPNPTNTK